MRPVIGIAHAAWSEGRADGLARLLSQLEPQGVAPYVQVSTEPEHAQQWAVRLWQWAATQDAPAILLNDDVDVSPELVAAVDRMTDALPGELLSLHCQLPVAKSLAEAGVPYLTSYWTSGPAYVIPRGAASKLVAFTATLPQAILDKWNEDTYSQLWGFSMRRPMWHPLPSLAQHDVSVPSTLGYDKHTMRIAVADWRAYPVPADATVHEPPPYFENPWMPLQNLLTLEAQRAFAQKPVMARRCWWCQDRPVKFNSATTGAGMCGECIMRCVGAAMGA